MDNTQRELIQKMIETHIEIETLYDIPYSFVENYGEDQLDEQLIKDIKEFVSDRITELSKKQEEAMHEYDCYYRGKA